MGLDGRGRLMVDYALRAHPPYGSWPAGFSVHGGSWWITRCALIHPTDPGRPRSVGWMSASRVIHH